MSRKMMLPAVFLVAVGGLSTPAGATAEECIDGHAGDWRCSRIDMAARLSSSELGGGSLNDIWGWTDPDTGREVALVGREGGTSFVDVSDPSAPVYLGELPSHDDIGSGKPGMQKPGGDDEHDDEGHSSWRDVKVVNDHAVIVSEASGHGIQVFDLRTLPAAQDVSDNGPREFEETAHYDGIGKAHNIVVNDESNFAYAVGGGPGDPASGGLHAVDFSNPADPVQAGVFADDGYTHDAQCVDYAGPDADYDGREICIAANKDTITVVDVTDKSGMQQVSRVDYEAPGYTHQAWFGRNQRYLYVNDETDEQNHGFRTRLMVLDLQDLDHPEVVRTWFGASNAIDHNNYVRGDFLFQANYTSGLRVLDVSRPASPIEIAWFDTQPGNDGAQFDGAWSVYPFFESGTVVVSDISNGLFVLRPTDLESGATAEIGVTMRELSGSDDTTVESEVIVANDGMTDAADVELAVSMPSDVVSSIGSAAGGCNVTGTHLRCRLNGLPAGDEASFRIEAEPRDTGGEGRAFAMASAAGKENSPGNNRDGITLDVPDTTADSSPDAGVSSGGGGAVFLLPLMGAVMCFRRAAGRWRRMCRPSIAG